MITNDKNIPHDRFIGVEVNRAVIVRSVDKRPRRSKRGRGRRGNGLNALGGEGTGTVATNIRANGSTGGENI